MLQLRCLNSKAIIDEVETLLSSKVHFYLLASDLYRIQGKHKDFYRSSLRILGCTALTLGI